MKVHYPVHVNYRLPVLRCNLITTTALTASLDAGRHILEHLKKGEQNGESWEASHSRSGQRGIHTIAFVCLFVCLLLLLFCFVFLLFRATLTAYGSSQAMGQIGAAAASHSHSHSHGNSVIALGVKQQSKKLQLTSLHRRLPSLP